MKKIFIFIVLFLAAANAFGQSVRPLSTTFEPMANFDNAEWRWSPLAGFKVVGPIDSGAQISVEYTLPNGAVWQAVKCETNPFEANDVRKFSNCGYANADAAKATNQTGVFGFKLKLSNPLNGDSKILQSGKFTVSKLLYNPDGAAEKNKQFYYYVDNDWRLSYGYVGNWTDVFYAEVWLKNRIVNRAQITGHIFPNGKEIANNSPSYATELYPKENPKNEYTQLAFSIDAAPQGAGEYEFKIMRDKRLARSIKFTLGADGKPVANGIGANLIGWGILTPVQILGDGDGTVNRATWKDGVWGTPIANLPPQ